MLHAMIDVGSNTIRMAVYEIEGSRIEMLMKKKHAVGLASYLADGVMQKEGIDKAVEVLQGFRSFLQSLRITEVSAFATAALRNAKNSAEAVQEIWERSSVLLHIVSGDEEAELGFAGATHDLPEDTGLLVDIGGASTEIVFFQEKRIVRKRSFPMGSRCMHKKFSSDVLSSREECRRMRQEAERILGAAEEFREISYPVLCGIGGTFKGAMALCQEVLGGCGSLLRVSEMRELLVRFQRRDAFSEEDVAHLMRAVPERMDTIVPGLVIADVIAERFNCEEIRYSDSGVREGYIYSRIL